jgi:hypothetical protein
MSSKAKKKSTSAARAEGEQRTKRAKIKVVEGGIEGEVMRGDGKPVMAFVPVISTNKSKQPRAKKEPKPKAPKRVSLVDAAAQILAESGATMKVTELYAAVETSGLWTPGAGKTPKATLAAAIIREIAQKGDGARFKKVDRGAFAAAAGKQAQP